MKGSLMIFLGVISLLSANLLQNPDFEEWVNDSTPQHWVVEWREKAGIFKDVQSHSGSFGVRLVRRQAGTGNNRGLKQQIRVTEGQVYQFSVWFKDNNDSVTGGILITWRKSDTSFLSSTAVRYTRDSIDWQNLTIIATAPETAYFADCLIRTYGFTGSPAGHHFFVDNASFLDLTGIQEENTQPIIFSKKPTYFISRNHLSNLPFYEIYDCLGNKIDSKSLKSGLYFGYLTKEKRLVRIIIY